MQVIKAGNFKAKCLQVMDQVNKTKKSVIITKRNVPIAKLVPFETSKDEPIFGCMQHLIEIKGDITKPTGEEWDVLAEDD